MQYYVLQIRISLKALSNAVIQRIKTDYKQLIIEITVSNQKKKKKLTWI